MCYTQISFLTLKQVEAHRLRITENHKWVTSIVIWTKWIYFTGIIIRCRLITSMRVKLYSLLLEYLKKSNEFYKFSREVRWMKILTEIAKLKRLQHQRYSHGIQKVIGIKLLFVEIQSRDIILRYDSFSLFISSFFFLTCARIVTSLTQVKLTNWCSIHIFKSWELLYILWFPVKCSQRQMKIQANCVYRYCCVMD